MCVRCFAISLSLYVVSTAQVLFLSLSQFLSSSTPTTPSSYVSPALASLPRHCFPSHASTSSRALVRDLPSPASSFLDRAKPWLPSGRCSSPSHHSSSAATCPRTVVSSAPQILGHVINSHSLLRTAVSGACRLPSQAPLLPPLHSCMPLLVAFAHADPLAALLPLLMLYHTGTSTPPAPHAYFAFPRVGHSIRLAGLFAVFPSTTAWTTRRPSARLSNRPRSALSSTSSPCGRWLIHQLDVNNAFLRGSLEEIIRCQQPPGFVNPSSPDHICCRSPSTA